MKIDIHFGKVCASHPELMGERDRFSHCQECQKAKAAKYRAEHPEEAKAKLAAWRIVNKGKTRANKRKFQEENRAHRCAYQRNRDAEKLQRTPAWANHDHISGVYELCGMFRRVGLDLEVDHVIPLKGKHVSGLHVESNLQILHSLKNRSKKNRYEVHV